MQTAKNTGIQPEPGPDDAPSEAGPQPVPLVAALGLALFSGIYLMVAEVPILPLIARQLGADSIVLGWTFAVQMLVVGVSGPLLGRLGDAWGRRRTLLLTLSGAVLGTLVVITFVNVPAFLIGRGLQALPVAAIPVVFSSVRDALPARRIPVAVSVLGLVPTTGVGITAVTVGALTGDDYRLPFGVGAVLAVAALVWVARVVPEGTRYRDGHTDVAGAVLLVVWVVALLLTVSHGHDWGWTSPRVLGLIALATAGLALWLVVERRARAPIADLQVLRRPAVLLLLVLAALTNAAFQGITLLASLFQQTPTKYGFGFGFTPFQVGLMTLVISAGALCAIPLGAWLTSAFGAKTTMWVGSLLTALGALLWIPLHGSPVMYAVTALLSGLGGMFIAGKAVVLMQIAPPGQYGVSLGMTYVMTNVGGSFGATVLGVIMATHMIPGTMHPSESAYSIGYLVIGLCALVGAVIGLLLPTRGMGSLDEVSPHGAPATAVH
ncbi:MFS transporter [Streptomyces sp. NPDC005480]|uniref:MFS transporter n=1 Tax=Streptomyces sp. NPDC005480 TaxID=3154880 RepID=UPI0033A0AE4A